MKEETMLAKHNDKIVVAYRCLVVCCLLLLVGFQLFDGGPSKKVITESKLAALLRKPYDEATFHKDGTTSELDAWGRVIRWEMDYYREQVHVMSSGRDGLPYTDDDIRNYASCSASSNNPIASSWGQFRQAARKQ